MKLCIFGAGNSGKNFVEKKIKDYMSQYTEIFFVDKNEKLWNTELYGIPIRSMNAIDRNTKVIITSDIYWNEIYQICCLNGFMVLGIYDIHTENIYTYKEICRFMKSGYKNEKFIQYSDDKTKTIEIGINKFMQTDELFENINEVAIMLSNLCNYACVHKKCPASEIKQKEILPSKVVFKILDELASINFEGTICFHIYNEPLIDPRLFWFIEYVKSVMPKAKVEVYSNGYYLNDEMADELKNIGTDILIVTGYGETEYNRLLNLNVDMAYYVLFVNLDERLNHYEDRKEVISSDICKTYFTQVPIFSNGDIGTCCLDYLHSYGIANICKTSLRSALNGERIIKIQKELLKGNRTIFTICKNCDWER